MDKWKRLTQGQALDLVIWLSGYTQDEVAKASKVSRPHLTNVINGTDRLTKDIADPIAHFLGVVPGRLLRLQERSRRQRERIHENKSKRQQQARAHPKAA